MSLIVSLLSGAAGGNVAGALMKDKSLGPIGNSLAGIVGGGLGATLLQAVGVLATSSQGGGGAALGEGLSGGVGGAVLMMVVGLVKNSMAERA